MSKIYQKSYPAGKNAGFTLIELLVVVLIIGILAAVALPQYQQAVLKTRLMRYTPFVKALANAEEAYWMANGQYTPNIEDLDIDFPADAVWAGASTDHGFVQLSDGSVLDLLGYGAYISDLNSANARVAIRIMGPNNKKIVYLQYLANSAHKFNQFFTYQGKVAYQLGDTQTAIVYDPEVDDCFLQPILQPLENVLTPSISQDYYDRYGYLEQYDRLEESYTLLSTVRAVGNKGAFTWMAPNRDYLLTLLSSTGYQTFHFSSIENDIIHTKDNRFLATLICCEGDTDSVLLFQIPAEFIQEEGVNEEDNFWLLEVELE